MWKLILSLDFQRLEPTLIKTKKAKYCLKNKEKIEKKSRIWTHSITIWSFMTRDVRWVRPSPDSDSFFEIGLGLTLGLVFEGLGRTRTRLDSDSPGLAEKTSPKSRTRSLRKVGLGLAYVVKVGLVFWVLISDSDSSRTRFSSPHFGLLLSPCESWTRESTSVAGLT